jgi:hypothetical protein
MNGADENPQSERLASSVKAMIERVDHVHRCISAMEINEALLSLDELRRSMVSVLGVLVQRSNDRPTK